MQTRLADTWCVIEQVAVPTWYIEPVEMTDEELEKMLEEAKEILEEGVEEVEHDTEVTLDEWREEQGWIWGPMGLGKTYTLPHYINESFFCKAMGMLGYGPKSHNEEDQEAS